MNQKWTRIRSPVRLRCHTVAKEQPLDCKGLSEGSITVTPSLPENAQHWSLRDAAFRECPWEAFEQMPPQTQGRSGSIRIDPGLVTGGSWLLRNLIVFVPATRPVEVASIREATLSLNRASVSGAAADSADVIARPREAR